MPRAITRNTLFYGDNLPILRDHLPDESVDLIYLDPPFNSNRSYNVLFKEESGRDSQAQIMAFEDTWHWGEDAERIYHGLVQNSPIHVSIMLGALRDFIGENQMMAYLVMMTARLIELHRVLKPTGSIYLHCDPTASHYLKVVMDTIFGGNNFVNEIVWKRTTAHNSGKMYGPVHDIILFYSKSEDYLWNIQYRELSDEYKDSHYKYVENGRRYKRENITGAGIRHGETGKPWHGIDPTPKGRHWVRPPSELDKLDANGKIYWPQKEGSWPYLKQFLDENRGMPLQDLWEDIFPINSQAAERLGYPTQKPLALLERIVEASSNPGDVVLDPFCGCGTAIAAAQKLNRRWIGIDITHLSISLMKYRLKDSFGLVEKVDYDVHGEPESIGGAKQLAKDDRYQFQWWALSLVQAKPVGGESGVSREGKKGSDKGIDGLLAFFDQNNKVERVILQVKSGKVKSGDIRDLCGVVEREEAAIGVFITLEEHTREMETEAVSAGFYHSELWQKDYPRIQILTIEELLNGKAIAMPPSAQPQFKQAEKVKKKQGEQGEMF